MYLGVEGAFDLPHHTIHIAEDYEGNLTTSKTGTFSSDDPSFYVQNACVTDPGLAPQRTQRALCARARHAPASERQLVRSTTVFATCCSVKSKRQATTCLAPHSLRARHHAGGLGYPLRNLSWGDVQSCPHAGPDAASPPAQPLRGPRRCLSGRRRNASRQRPAGDFRKRAHQHPAASRRPGRREFTGNLRRTAKSMSGPYFSSARAERPADAAAQFRSSPQLKPASVIDECKAKPFANHESRRKPIRLHIPLLRRRSHLVASVTQCDRLPPAWHRRRGPAHRSAPLALVRELRHLIAENARPLAEASASRVRGPLSNRSRRKCCRWLKHARFLEREADSILRSRRFGKRGRPLWLAASAREIHREPFGVVLVVGPGNYPLLLPGRRLMQALVAGNAVLLKPGAGGTAAARTLLRTVRARGIRSELVASLCGLPESARAAIAARPDKVLFTGSAKTGEMILWQLAPHLIPATMELSGCDCGYRPRDADLDLARQGSGVWSAPEWRRDLPIAPARLCHAQHRDRNRRSHGAGARNCRTQAAEPGVYCPAAIGARSSRAWRRRAFRGWRHGLKDGDCRRAGRGVAMARLLHEDTFAPLLSLVTVADDEEAVESRMTARTRWAPAFSPAMRRQPHSLPRASTLESSPSTI